MNPFVSYIAQHPAVMADHHPLSEEEQDALFWRCWPRCSWWPPAAWCTSWPRARWPATCWATRCCSSATVIGTYLFAMGIGSWLSRFVSGSWCAVPAHRAAGGLVGGLMPAALFVAHSSCRLPGGPSGAAVRLVLLVGMLVGLEIPLVMRILKRQFSQRWALKDLVSQVLTFDYLGALAVALAFPLLLVPHLGLIRTGVFFGLLNAAWRCGRCGCSAASCAALARMPLACALVAGLLAAAMAGADRLTTWAEDRFYGDTSSCAKAATTSASWSPAAGRRAPVPQRQPAVPQRDEYRYHEALVHPAMAAHGAPRRCWCWAAATAWRCARCCKHPGVSNRSRWSSWTRT
jgi:spermidine synthase